nr:hypothetical protein [[Phormidium] sp. ETS-05]
MSSSIWSPTTSTVIVEIVALGAKVMVLPLVVTPVPVMATRL